MKLVRYTSNGTVAFGALDNDLINPLGGNLKPSGAAAVELGSVRLLAPVAPSKIVAIGLNYADHAAEANRELPKEPMLFIKPSTAVIGPDDEIIYPPQKEGGRKRRGRGRKKRGGGRGGIRGENERKTRGEMI